ncbi:hypothetical protein [uncultured Jannaschia sp.]|uniref:hypothetical protein n=1 Tax=uncultured Jannaschia sp. TaxID=293347 RepID=UPI0026327B22|nr:hypothetical protein [uncultured Jannaschia sp.]
MTADDPKTIRRRKVLYIPGFDPFPPRRYRELYRREGAEQARLSGYALRLSAGSNVRSWQVDAQIEGVRTRTDFEVLVWSDLVAEGMSTSILGTYATLLRTAWIYLRSGAIRRLMRLRKGPMIAVAYSTVVLILQLAFAGVIAVLAWWACAVMAGGYVGQALGVAAGLVTGWVTLRWFKARDNRILAHYLLHDYAYMARRKGAYPAGFETRLAAFADRVAATCATDAEEVLVVGHSAGVHIGISVLADLIRANRIPDNRCAFLSLGQVVPMVSFLPNAQRLRDDLHLMGGQTLVPWVDVSAPGDGCTFALCDPVAISGQTPRVRTGPRILSAAFSRTLTPAKQKSLRRRFFRKHFQYLCAFDNLAGRPGEYDYFRVTAGPKRLADRFAGREDSPSTLRDPDRRAARRAA